MGNNYEIHLNFLPFEKELPDFFIYRKEQASPEESRPPDAKIQRYTLPVDPSDIEKRNSYWVSLTERKDYHQFRVSPSFNHQMTKWVLFQCLRKSIEAKLDIHDFVVPTRGFLREVRFPLIRHDEGEEELIVQPYYLRVKKLFGFLVDFHFRLKEGVQFSRKVQQHSLSLDQNYKRNLDCYADRVSKIDEFLEKRWDVVGSMTLPGVDIESVLIRKYQPVAAGRLPSKVYVFSNGKTSRSQFNGLQNNGPLSAIEDSPNLLFVFREQDRLAARTLAMALKGTRQRGKFYFPGFSKLFKSEITIDSNPVIVKEFSRQSAEQVLKRVNESNDPVVPIFLLPDPKDPGYIKHKAIFAHKGIATQACTLPTILNDNTLRFSVANIALQIFCKAGGSPWKMQVTNGNTLIIGISQSHKVNRANNRVDVEKYIAFSVFTDNSGLFQKIQILGEGDNEKIYLDRLRENLRTELSEHSQHFDRIAVHTSFRLRKREIEAIEQVVREAGTSRNSNKCRFAVIKVNQKNRFFGTNLQVKSYVPYEGSWARLGRNEYLIWFEGIFPDNTTVRKAFPGPTHIDILSIGDESGEGDMSLLQDLINLSGANWRGFNAKSTPVSVFYCHLVADFVQQFHNQDLPMPAVEQIRPWFL